MKNKILKFLFVLICIVFFYKKTLASSKEINNFFEPFTYQKNFNNLNLYIFSKKIKHIYPNKTILSGNVKILYKKNKLFADSIIIKKNNYFLKKNNYKINAYGNVNYIGKNFNLKGSNFKLNLNKKKICIFDGKYKINNIYGYGKYDYIKYNIKKFYTIAKNVTFTCNSLNNKIWNILGKKIIYKNKKKIINIWNVYFKINKIPIFYTPYIQIPIKKKNKFKFLMPSLKKKHNNGIEFKIPYYIYFSQKYNFIIIPHYIKKIGKFIEIETRFLKKNINGLLKFNLFFNKKSYKKNKWLLYWKYNFILNKHWKFHTNYINSNDLDFFKKIKLNYGDMIKGFIKKDFILHFSNKKWDAYIKYNKIYSLNKKINNNFQKKPQIEIFYESDKKGPFSFKLFNQITYFTNIYKNKINVIRFHSEPIINLFLFNYLGKLNTEIKLMNTYYKISNLKKNKNTFFKQKYNRSIIYRFLPQFKTHGKIILERNIKILDKYIQTLEIQAKYLYIPYKDQNNIKLYDTSILKTNYINIFRDYLYNNIDRISSANQLPIGITTRIYNSKAIEKFHASIGQIYFFSYKNIINNSKVNHIPYIGSDFYISDLYWYINNKLKFYCILEYQNSYKKLKIGDIIIEFNNNKMNTLFLSYHNLLTEFFKKKHTKINNSKQFSLIGSYPLNKSIFFIGSFYYNFKNKKIMHEAIGIKYNRNYWSINLGFSKSFINSNKIKNQYKNKIFLKFELNGLKNKNSLENIKFISNILPYQTIF
ncbi:LPS assembly protein LptD [Sodalis-like secondary symbiont of Drepanosiphum platanoidis]|uniref:LPS assembly protein LptD n=1 Tax=Sodalis-like secondary symbiont of Drepanosiphum platanoidis TaxID=2994493 RepID=UPI00346405AF